MVEEPSDLPPHIVAALMKFVRVVDGNIEVTEVKGLVEFLLAHHDTYPALDDLVTVNWEKVWQHFEDTGEVPPGIELISTTNLPGTNVTRLQVIRGPIPPKKTK